MDSPRNRFGRVERVSLAVALMWGAVLLAAAVFAPVYQSSGGPGPVAAGRGADTLAGVNGWEVLLVAGAPLLAAALVAGALWQRGSRRGAGAFAWTVTGLLAAVNGLALLSIGVLLLPVTAAAVCACAGHGRQGRPAAGHSGLAS